MSADGSHNLWLLYVDQIKQSLLTSMLSVILFKWPPMTKSFSSKFTCDRENCSKTAYDMKA
jgi:hypothetical protein